MAQGVGILHSTSDSQRFEEFLKITKQLGLREFWEKATIPRQ